MPTASEPQNEEEGSAPTLSNGLLSIQQFTPAYTQGRYLCPAPLPREITARALSAMAHRTGSGRVFHKQGPVATQSSPWAEASEALQVLLELLDFQSVLTARLVCQAWRGSCSTAVKQLLLEQPASARAALSLGHKAAAAFNNATTVCLKLLDVPAPVIDLTGDGDGEQLELFAPDSLGRPAAGAALLRQLSKAGRLQQLQLSAGVSQTCTLLPALLKAAPQLLVLDLSCCAHKPSDLLVLAQHAPGLQELLLHCQAFTTLSGRPIRHGDPEWARHGGNTRYEAEHLAALAGLPHLQLLEVPRPATSRDGGSAIDWFKAVGSLTSLTALHVIQHGKCYFPPQAAAIAALSGLTRLRELRCEAGGAVHEAFENAQADCWGTVLPHMPHLTRLELVGAAAGDQLLRVIGSSGPKLRQLVLQSNYWGSSSSTDGADAIAHVGHIELVCYKGLDCSRNLQLLQLPGVKWVDWECLHHAWADVTWEPLSASDTQVGYVWSQERCACESCWFRWRGNRAMDAV